MTRKKSFRPFVAGSVRGLEILTPQEERWLFEEISEEHLRFPISLQSIVVQRDYFYDAEPTADVVSSFYRQSDGTAMELVSDGGGRCHLIIVINVCRKRIRLREEILRSTMRQCRSYEECFRNRVKHEIGHYRHIGLSDDRIAEILGKMTPVSEYAKKSIYEAFAEAYSIDRIDLETLK